MLLLDTDAVSHLIRGTSRPGLEEALLGLPVEDRFLSAITVAEVLYGIEKRGGMEACASDREQFFSA